MNTNLGSAEAGNERNMVKKRKNWFKSAKFGEKEVQGVLIRYGTTDSDEMSYKRVRLSNFCRVVLHVGHDYE